MNILSTIKKLHEEFIEQQFNKLFNEISGFTASLVTISILLTYGSPSAFAKPNGNFRITTNNGNLVEVYGDNFPSYKGPIHLWKDSSPSNLFKLGKDEETGNEVQVANKPDYCVTTDSDLGSKPKAGTPLVIKRDCARSFNFKFDGKKIYMGRYPDMCWDIPNNKDNPYQQLTIHPCNGSPAQQFDTGNQVIKQNSSNVSKSIVKIYPEYEYWLVADTQKSSSLFSSTSDYSAGSSSFVNTGGHAWVGIITRNRNIHADNSVSYSNWEAWKTWGYWKKGSPTGLKYNMDHEMNTINDILNSRVNGRYVVRKANITRSRAEYISANPGLTGCDANKYGFNARFLDSSECICTVFATRHWHVFTDKREDYRPWGVFDRAPTDVAKKIKEMNSKDEGFFDSGNIWN